MKNWVKELRKMLGNDICLVIVGNKMDLEKERHVSQEEAERCVSGVVFILVVICLATVTVLTVSNAF